DPTPLLELVALDDLAVRDLAVAVLAPFLLLDARLTCRVQLIEGDRSFGFGRRKHLDRDVHQRHLQEALPCGACAHTVTSLESLRSSVSSRVLSARVSYRCKKRPT